MSKVSPSGRSLVEVMQDRGLAALGDAYVNFVYSLALTRMVGKPVGAKATGKVLAEALKSSGIREIMPRRLDRHDLADAAEALMVYAWLEEVITLEDCVEVLSTCEDKLEAFTELLKTVKASLEVKKS